MDIQWVTEDSIMMQHNLDRFKINPFDSIMRVKKVTAQQYGRNWDKVLKCTNIPSDIDSIHNRSIQPSFGGNWSSARGPRHPPPFQELWWLKMKD